MDRKQRKQRINAEKDTTAIMFHSLKKETGHERTKDISTNKNQEKTSYDIIPSTCPLIHTLI